MRHIFKCESCNKYTLKEKCICGSSTIGIKPPKFSLKDEYANYRRKAKEKEWKEKDLI